MRASTAVSALLATVLATTLALGAQAGSETPARSVEKTFLIPSSEGYGVADCLTTPGSACGQTVADSWCEAQGFAAAGSFGIAAPEEYTGSVDLPVSKPSERPLRITCKD
ncbi:hypothetical protein [Methylobacterium hispanicum]|uniref:hypothetical protein n=1 Tax=Methylobacterium hispanicum TaxID=270350 RepID=UPI002F318A68